MQIQDMLTLYEYNYWATKRILAASALGHCLSQVHPINNHLFRIG